MVQGYHIYKDIYMTIIEEELLILLREAENADHNTVPCS